MIRTKPDVENETLYRASTATRILNISRSTIDRAIKDGRITAERNTNGVFVSGEELMKYWKQHR
jgi:excisionase family DNA binding protein